MDQKALELKHNRVPCRKPQETWKYSTARVQYTSVCDPEEARFTNRHDRMCLASLSYVLVEFCLAICLDTN